ncbi:hypothetical protein ASD76_16170 [Altererythrobacter sp. Root672]|nr:hypothetical protein ASD76_16170 [Altererythrobacter sp. Root672]
MRLVAATAGLLLLAGCTGKAPEPEAEATEVPKELAQADAARAAAGIGTPMEQRVAVIGLLNKRNNISQDLEMKPGEARRVGDVVVRLSACERTAPWEEPPETGAFVQVIVLERADADSEPAWRRIFSGWLFKNSPSLNVVEHPIYDVWVKDCKMSFPGEESPVSDSSGPTPRATPTAGAEPAPEPTVTAPSPAPVETPAANDA